MNDADDADDECNNKNHWMNGYCQYACLPRRQLKLSFCFFYQQDPFLQDIHASATLT